MSDEMPSWRSLASAASRSIKSYVSQRDLKRPFPASRDVSTEGTRQRQTWGQWAGQKLRQVQGDGTEQMILFPGWGTRRLHEPPSNDNTDAAFDIDLYVSGFTSRSSGQGFNTRGGRAFLKLAKSFAALPKLAIQASINGAQANWAQDSQMSRSTSDLLKSRHLPPTPEDMDDEAEMQALEDQFRALEVDSPIAPSGRKGETEFVASSGASQFSFRSSSSTSSSAALGSEQNASLPAGLQKWHTNLETRLYPFWCSALSNRTIRVSVYPIDPSSFESKGEVSGTDPDARRPLVRRDFVTGADGSFQARFRISWEVLTLHPACLRIAFGDRRAEYELFVTAELLPPRTPNTSSYQQPPRLLATPTATSSISIPLTHAQVRVISDIDDTVKVASVLSGARAVFHNVFVKDLSDCVIPGMAEWYTQMWQRGVRFHYVSNGPFEILPVLNEFFQLCRLPPGSVKLRSYGGRSLFSGLLSAPAARKRGGVVEILDNFPDSQFVLIGDSGEQDIELYAAIAKERPAQILAVFIRDVGGDIGSQFLDDPTGARVIRLDRAIPASLSRRSSSKSSKTQSPMIRSISEKNAPATYAVRRPKRMQSDTVLSATNVSASDGYFTAEPVTASPVTEEPEEMSIQSSPGIMTERDSYDPYTRTRQVMSEAERRRNDFQMRVWRARLEMPEHIPLRVFRQPEECTEVTIILDGLLPRERE